jgi:hypothetical protein
MASCDAVALAVGWGRREEVEVVKAARSERGAAAAAMCRLEIPRLPDRNRKNKRFPAAVDVAEVPFEGWPRCVDMDSANNNNQKLVIFFIFVF